MKVFLCETQGLYLGFYCVVVAATLEDARSKLWEELYRSGLLPKQRKHPNAEIKIQELDTCAPSVFVLFNGDY